MHKAIFLSLIMGLGFAPSCQEQMPETSEAKPSASPQLPETTPTPESNAGEAALLGERFSLKLGASQSIEDEVTLTFQSLDEDSRCPEGVQCIWQGQAKITLKVQIKDQEPDALQLTLPQEKPDLLPKSPYAIAFVDLSPYPQDGVTVVTEDYEASLQVTKNPS